MKSLAHFTLAAAFLPCIGSAILFSSPWPCVAWMVGWAVHLYSESRT